MSGSEELLTAEPQTPVSRGWTLRFSLLWFGFWMANLVPIQLLLPNQLDVIDHAHKIRDFGAINGAAGVAALITLPLFGALCDRTRSKLGRRRVWVIAGVAVFAVGLLLTGAQTSPVALGACWLFATLGINMATSGLTAAIADEVPDRQRGAISSAIYGPQAVGLLFGLVVITATGNSGLLAYSILAVALVATAWPFIRFYRESTGITVAVAPLTLRSIVAGMWISPREHPDFAWGFGGRLLVNIGNALGTTYLLFFLQDDLKLKDPDGGLLILTLIYLVFTVTATYGGGYLSDRSGRRRIFVLWASLLQAMACILLTFFPSFPSAMVAAALLGAGYGAFMSVDQALITHVLPDALSRAKDLGIMNVGSVGPQALAPLVASLIISSLGGYPVLFATAGVTTLAGAAMIYRIKSVR
ncbi:MFS transporter [Jatrophihabitans sp. GAS493]|uniref:MFS transporter n=1 Tax=Jatrophihabitans sp. GAS493 TaxID=1907575 RepID=UPI000BB8894E|nr:MFS transporter [Jatrophihabitans sp. GAS493]SOD74321.1 MFS transporter [Jatrophihabitans sp. GAS493]